MSDSLFDERPGACDGCCLPDYASVTGFSVRQITWNNILRMWLCADCMYSWSNWVGCASDDLVNIAMKPGFCGGTGENG